MLATNVAETSLTVPGIRYVIDPGAARISRYSHRTKVQRLPIEPISQASANQRKGRCGRTSDGICIRLYSEDDFLTRPEFTDAEILRTNLASVILQMTAAGLGDIEKFPFIDPPDRRNVKDGVQLLEELHALDSKQKDPRKRLTQVGRKLAQLPVDPRLARMVLEADRNGCVREVMVIAAALSIQDPRERPSDKQQQADQHHARFKDESSDFLAFLNLWKYIRERQKELSSSAFRRMCRNEFLNYLRIREWQDIYSQLRTVAKTMDIHMSEQDAAPDHVHTSLLAGLLSHVGLKNAGGEGGKDGAKNEYLGARGAKFAVFPGSALFKKPPRWVMSAELVETSRLWARVNAKIEPEWIEPLAQHLVKRTYSEPHWEQKQAAVMAYERVTLYGVPIVAQRKVNYGRIDPETSRDLFVPSSPAKFVQGKLSNQAKLALSSSPHGCVQALFEDCVAAAADRLIAARGGPAWDEESFRKLFEAVRSDITDATLDTVRKVQEVLAAWQSCERRLKDTRSPVLLPSLTDIREQLSELITPGFVTAHGVRRLPDLMRYLVAVDRRLQQLPGNADRDRARMAKVREMRDEYAWLLEQFPPGRPVPQEALEIRWMIEELRVSYFAHALGTAYPVSDKRIVKAIDAAAP
ncbi:hypothetical protein SANTM175S_08698 [Streptomyces antimycoticus]